MNPLVRPMLAAGLSVLLGCAWLGTSSPTPKVVLAPEPVPDTIRVKGDVLRGRLVRLGTERVEFETIYGEGALSIAYADIEELSVHGEIMILHGERFEASQGRVLGLDDGEVLIAPEPRGTETAAGAPEVPVERIPVKGIKSAVRAEDFEDSLLTRLRTRYSHWRADFDLGFTFEQGAVKKRKISTFLEMERRKAPTRFSYNLDYAFETQEKIDQPTTTTKNELYSSALFERDLTELLDRSFAFVLAGGEWDKPRAIDWRVFPGAGLGYRLVDSEMLQLQLSGGFGYVGQAFKGEGAEHWPAGVLGSELRWALPLDAELSAALLFMPRLDGSNWLYRSRFVFTIPIWDPLTLRFRITEVNDDNPEPSVGNNKLTTTLGFGLRF